MKIGIVTQSYHPRPGGVTENVYHTALKLTERGHDVTVITSGRWARSSNGRSPDEETEGVGDDRVRVLRLGRNVLVPVNGAHSNVALGMGLSRSLKRILHAESFDLLHTHNPVAPTLPLLNDELILAVGAVVVPRHAGRA